MMTSNLTSLLASRETAPSGAHRHQVRSSGIPRVVAGSGQGISAIRSASLQGGLSAESVAASGLARAQLVLSASRALSTAELSGVAPGALRRTSSAGTARGGIGGGGILDLAIDPSERRYLLAGTAAGSIGLWDTRPTVDGKTKTGAPGTLEDYVHYSSGTKPLFVILRGGMVSGAPPPPRHYNPTALVQGHVASVTSVEWYPYDTGMMISGGSDGAVLAWDTNTVTAIGSWTSAGAVSSLAASAAATSHSLIAVASKDSAPIRLLDLRSSAYAQTLLGPRASPTAVAWSPTDPHTVAGAAVDGTLRVWDVRHAIGAMMTFDSSPAATIAKKQGLAPAYEQSQMDALDHRDRSRRLAGLGGLSSGPSAGSRKGKGPAGTAHGGPVWAVAWAPQGDYLYSLGGDETLRRWESRSGLHTGVRYGSVSSPSGLSGRFALSPSGRNVFAPVSGGGVGVWDAQSGVLQQTLHGHFGLVSSIVAHPDEVAEVYSGALDGRILAHVPEPLELAAKPPRSNDPISLLPKALSITGSLLAGSQGAAGSAHAPIAVDDSDNWSSSEDEGGANGDIDVL